MIRIPRLAIFVFLLTALYSCRKDIPLPAGTVTTEIVSNSAKFRLTDVSNAETYEWDFGDGSPLSGEMDPLHIYPEFGRTYTVTLKLKGAGGETVVSINVEIPPMTGMEMLTGGQFDVNGRTWKLSSSNPGYEARPDTLLTRIRDFTPSFFSSMGLSSIISDKFIFFDDGSYRISHVGQGVSAGLNYCSSKNIPNAPPGSSATAFGFTIATPWTVPEGLTYAFNEKKDLKVQVAAEGKNSGEIVFRKASTLSFSKGGFIGFLDWMSECIVLEMKEESVKLALFHSGLPANSPLSGKITRVLVLSFEVAE